MKLKSDKVKKRRGASAPTDPDDEALARHVAELVKRGRVKRGKAGPPLAEILRPGPAAPGAQKALRWSRKG
jgi:hypothetical protein